MRKKIIAGNWKMNTTWEVAQQLVKDTVALAQGIDVSRVQLILCPPFPYLLGVRELTSKTAIRTGAQDCSRHAWGAYTGEVSAHMLHSAGISYVIIGHSERRQYFGEDSALLAAKIDQALAAHLTPIFCCGEPLEIREKNTHEAYVTEQIEASLLHLPAAVVKDVIIAYEPVWAIGTGKTASAQQAQDMHAMIRRRLAKQYGEEIAQSVHVLYGGSMKPDNAKELCACPDVDGGLIGGASLKAADFIAIAQAGK